jgi:predicted DNA-binding transcriptional regulator AlpA
MTTKRLKRPRDPEAREHHLPDRMMPRLLSRKEAALYVGLSPGAFDVEVAVGTFPSPFLLKRTRRRLWDIRALDATMDKAAGLSGANNVRQARK